MRRLEDVSERPIMKVCKDATMMRGRLEQQGTILEALHVRSDNTLDEVQTVDIEAVHGTTVEEESVGVNASVTIDHRGRRRNG